MHRYRSDVLLVTLCLLFLLLPGHIHAAKKKRYFKEEQREEQAFIFDRYWSPQAASSIVISSRILLNSTEDWLFGDRSKHGVWGRLGSFGCNLIANDFLYTFNHEVYGHGFRVRSLGWEVLDYSFEILGGGATRYSYPLDGPMDEKLLVTMGGTEANSVLTQAILLKYFEQGCMNARTYELFFYTSTYLAKYVLLTILSDDVRNAPGNDIMYYIDEINVKYCSKKMDLERISTASLVSTQSSHLRCFMGLLGLPIHRARLVYYTSFEIGPHSLHATHQSGTYTFWYSLLSRQLHRA